MTGRMDSTKYHANVGKDAIGMMNDTNSNLSDVKRRLAPEGFGDECPVCGEPFDPGSAGVAWPDETNTIDAIAWTKVCHGPVAEHIIDDIEDLGYDPDNLVMEYIHKDDSGQH